MMMRRFVVVFVGVASFVAAFASLLAGCGGVTMQGVAVAPAATIEDPAERVAQRLLETPEQVAEVSGVIYAVGIGESRDMQFGLNKAEHDARIRIARFIAGGADKFSVTLVGARIEWRKVLKDGAQYRAIVLIAMPSPPASPQEGGMIMPQ